MEIHAQLELYLFVGYRNRKAKREIFYFARDGSTKIKKSPMTDEELKGLVNNFSFKVDNPTSYSMVKLRMGDEIRSNFYVTDEYNKEVDYSRENFFQDVKNVRNMRFTSFSQETPFSIGDHIYNSKYLVRVLGGGTDTAKVYKLGEKEVIFESKFSSISSYYHQWGSYHRGSHIMDHYVYFLNSDYASIIQINLKKLVENKIVIVEKGISTHSPDQQNQNPPLKIIVDFAVNRRELLALSSERKIFHISRKTQKVVRETKIEIPAESVHSTTISVFNKYVLVSESPIETESLTHHHLYLYENNRNNRLKHKNSINTSTQCRLISSNNPVHQTSWFTHENRIYAASLHLFGLTDFFVINRDMLYLINTADINTSNVQWRIIPRCLDRQDPIMLICMNSGLLDVRICLNRQHATLAKDDDN